MERNREFRERVQEEKKKMMNDEIFESAFYKEMLVSIAGEMTGGTLKKVELVKNRESTWAGRCNDQRVQLNLENRITASFPTVPLKSDSMVGILGHECGHWNFSDFKLRKEYLNSLLKGEWYRKSPKAETEEEAQHLEEMNGYLKGKHPAAMVLLEETASFIQNMLEDIFVEQEMCKRYPGSIRRGILQNRVRRAEWIPSLTVQLENGYEPVAVLLNLMAQYSLSGTVNNWEEKTDELLEILELIKPVIDAAVIAEDSVLRMEAANRILLLIWKVLAEEIKDMDREQNEEQETQEGQPSDQAEPQNGRSEEPSEEEPKAQENMENSASSDGLKSGQSAQTELTQKAKEKLEQIQAQLPVFLLEKDEETVNRTMQNKEGMAKADRQLLKEQVIETTDRLMEYIQGLAEEAAEKELEERICMELSRELLKTEFDGDHRKVKKRLQRESKVSAEAVLKWQECEDQVRKIMRRMKPRLLPVLSCQGTYLEQNLFFGSQINYQALYEPSKRIYRNLEVRKQVNTAVALLVDLSGSMEGERLEHARLCALCLYEFCRSAGIPILIYGHHTDRKYKRVQDETVYLHSFAEFESSHDDRYRIASMKAGGCNRDGAALWFVGEKLAKRPEKIKLLFSISDGFPNATCYSGARAEEDLMHIKDSLEKRRITMLTAAIGEDKKAIQRIYKEGFLDISDIEQLPYILPKQVLLHIRR